MLGITNDKIDTNTNSIDDGFNITNETLDTNFSSLYDGIDGVNSEVVSGFEKSIGGISSVDEHYVYYADGTIKSIDQYRTDFQRFVDQNNYYNNYSNLDDENNKNGNDNAKNVLNNGTNKIIDKFSFYNDVKNNVNDMVNVITNVDSAPKFFVDVECPWFSGNVCIIDLSWYSRFKDLGDSIICCFAYLSFLWHVFIRIPDIISGAGAISFSDNMSGDIDVFKKTGFSRGSSFKNRGF